MTPTAPAALPSRLCCSDFSLLPWLLYLFAGKITQDLGFQRQQRQVDLCVFAGFWHASLTLFLFQLLHQGLNTTILRDACTKPPVTFPLEDMLRTLSKPRFLNTVHVTLGRVWHQLGALRQQFLNIKDFPELERARRNIQGIRNNVYCLAQLLHHHLETPEPTQADSGALPPTTTTPSIFQAKLDSCRFLWGYHSFMGSVGRVIREWGDGSSRRRRHSPRHSLLRGWRKGARRIRPSRSSQSSKSRVRVPR